MLVPFKNKKHKNLNPKDRYETTMKEIQQLHLSTNELEFKQRLNVTYAKWVENEMTGFKDYFNKQWLKSTFKNGQIYHSPPVSDHPPLNPPFSRYG